MQKIGQVSLVVRDYDEAITFYTQKLGFTLVEDTVMSETKRWVVVSAGDGGCNLLLAKAANDEQRTRIGNQAGGRVFIFMYTDDIISYHQNLLKAGVQIVREICQETYGKVLVFSDLYENLWDLIEPAMQ